MEGGRKNEYTHESQCIIVSINMPIGKRVAVSLQSVS